MSILQPHSVCFHLLGGFSIYTGEISISPDQFRLRKTRSLLKLLALAPDHRLHRDQLIDALWPESDPEAAVNNLHQTLYAARKVLGHYGLPAHQILQLSDDFLRLCLEPDHPLWVDVEAFETAAAKVHGSQNPAAYQAVLDLYNGDLLPEDPYEDWASSRRENLRQVCLRLRLELAGLLEERGEYTAAITHLQQALASDPAFEEAHAGLMRLYALNNQPQQALRQYQTLVEILKTELDIEPSDSTHQLYEKIQSGQFTSKLPLAALFVHKPSIHNLPEQLSSFIGRKKELAEISDLLEHHRLLTLHGSGGTGKTRLVIKVAVDTLENYPDGAWFVDLAQLNHPDSILQVIAGVFGLHERKDIDLHSLLLNYLREKHLLLVLDNCEHLVEPCARLVSDVLLTCPKITFMITSREALNIPGEISYRVPSLSTPDPNLLPPVEDMDTFDAMRLFKDRAAAVSPGFNLSPANYQEIAHICYRLDGVPLAIELAAARVNVLSVEQIARRMDDRFRLLTGGSRIALPRQRTLQASIDWSYDLLTPIERLLLERLSVFYNGCTLESAEAVCGYAGIEKNEVLDTLSSLVNKSLIVVSHHPHIGTRYRMLETIRQYAYEKLTNKSQPSELQDRHLAYFVGWIEEMEPALRSKQAPTQFKRLDAEFENLRLAFKWARGKNSPEDNLLGLRLFNGLGQYWTSRGSQNEGIAWGRSVLDLPCIWSSQVI